MDEASGHGNPIRTLRSSQLATENKEFDRRLHHGGLVVLAEWPISPKDVRPTRRFVNRQMVSFRKGALAHALTYPTLKLALKAATHSRRNARSSQQQRGDIYRRLSR